MKESAFRVCLVMPANNPHALCFRELALLLAASIKSNGYACDFTFNQLDPDRINIILGYHLLEFQPDLKNYHYIPYQLEQIDSREFPFSENMKQVLRNGLTVWDHSEKNIQALQALGITARQVIPGYHPQLETIRPAGNKDVDILFYGSIGERRKKILDELAKYGRLQALFGVYGEQRDTWIARSKLVLNLNHYSQQLFQSVRVSYLLNNKIPVLSESARDDPYPKVQLNKVSYENLVSTCLQLIKEPETLSRQAQAQYQQFKTNYPMTRLIAEAIAALPL